VELYNEHGTLWIHPRHRSILPTVVFHPRCDMTSRRQLRSSTSRRLGLSGLYSRQAGIAGFWCYRLERPASPRHVCVVTRCFQTTTQDISIFLFLARHYHMTRVLLLPFNNTVGHLWSSQYLRLFDLEDRHWTGLEFDKTNVFCYIEFYDEKNTAFRAIIL